MGYPMGSGLVDVTKNNVMACQVELVELLNELPWKPWHQYDATTRYDRESFKTELVDCILFLINIANEANITPEELLLTIEKKQEHNLKRKEFKNNDRYKI